MGLQLYYDIPRPILEGTIYPSAKSAKKFDQNEQIQNAKAKEKKNYNIWKLVQIY